VRRASVVLVFAMLGVSPLVTDCGADGLFDLLPIADAGTNDRVEPVDTGLDATGSGDGAAPDGAPCVDGGCACGLTACATGCFDLDNDPDHCGHCTQTCAHYQFCHRGSCECLPGFTLCTDGACHFLPADPDHCGDCNAAPCASGEKCENGNCTPGACTSPLTGCPVAGNRMSCVSIAAGLPYCGDCTTVCGPDQVCAAGACRAYSPSTPCTTCPCSSDCARTEGTPSTCCAGVASGAQPICVHGTSCP
jgi:hypothetical protein